MIIEYILLLTAFVLLLMKVIFYAPFKAFEDAGPRLGARVEKHLVSGRGFEQNPIDPILWKEPPKSER